jgi:hypothetical protein
VLTVSFLAIKLVARREEPHGSWHVPYLAATVLPHGDCPTHGGEWRVRSARFCTWMDQYHDRTDEAGRFARRLLHEMDSLWVFLAQHGVEPTNNCAERALRFGAALSTWSSLRKELRSRDVLPVLIWHPLRGLLLGTARMLLIFR